MGLLQVRAALFWMLRRSSTLEAGCGWRQPFYILLSRTLEGSAHWSLHILMEFVKQVVSRCFFNMPDSNMPFVQHGIEVQYVSRILEMLQTSITFHHDVVDLSRRRLSRLFRSFYLILEVDT